MQHFTRRNRRLPLAMILSGVLLLLSITLIGTVAAQSNGPQSPQAATETTFTYQGRLLDNGVPATGTYDLQFTLYDAANAGAQIGSVVTQDDVQVSGGYFTVLLDFGNVFNGTVLFMQIEVRPGSSTGSYTALSPRVNLTAAPYASYALNNWGLSGNGGLNSSNYLGTRDNMTLTIGVSGTAAMRIVPAYDPGYGFAPNMIGGSSANIINPTNIAGATIAGGGVGPSPNRVGASYAFVGGGALNAAIGYQSAVAGGGANQAVGYQATVGGGNTNQATGHQTTVGGGNTNQAAGYQATVGGGNTNQANGPLSFIGGGSINSASGYYAAISGGAINSASGDYSAIGGGHSNLAAMSYAYVGGGYSNTVAIGADFGTIGGGRQNLVSSFEATVGGGRANAARGGDSTIGGGYANTASASASFIGGGQGNVVTPTAAYGALGGGLSNVINAERATVSGGVYNTAAGMASAIGGGGSNTTIGSSTVIGGGSSNTANGYASTIGGGTFNITGPDNYATVGGGTNNDATGGVATVSGGDRNAANGSWSVVGGGLLNIAAGQNSTISGGNVNYASGDYATIAGGTNNTASGYIATVAGGSSNAAQGSGSFAAGTRAKANHNGAFVWGDSSPFNDVASTAANQFIARASGGATFFTTYDLSTGVTVAAGSGSWSSVSDRNVKANFAAIDPRDVLQRLAQIPISTWNYKAQDATIRHIGPMAQDFAAAFGVGEDDTHISAIDADGVSLAAIQGLYQLSLEKDQQIAQLQARLENLENLAAPIGTAAPNGLIWFVAGAVIGLVAFSIGSRRAKMIK